MNYGLKLFTGLCAISCLGACASQRGPHGPQNGPPPGDMPRAELVGGLVAQPVALLFTSLDTDHDATTSKAELQSATPSLWESLNSADGDNVGALIYAEWAERMLGSSDALPNRLSFDTNLDGRINESKFAECLLREFDRLDGDADGKLTRAELLVRMQQRQMQQGREGPGGRGNGDRPPPPGGRQ